MEGVVKLENKNIIRFVNFQIVTYDLRNGNSITITPVPPQAECEFNISMGIEKLLIEAQGDLNEANIHENTLNNFSNLLSDYQRAIRGLT
jgi:hypothetical protein